MADAIPVHSEPKKGKKVVNVQPSPSLDGESGVVMQGDYAAKEREGTEGAGAVRQARHVTALANGATREDW